MKKENITLVGMPGAGKSTVGVVLAKIAAIQHGNTINDIQRLVVTTGEC